MRTVAAFNGERVECARYQNKLDTAKESAIAAGIRTGILLGVMLFIIFCSYAVGMVFGASEVPSLHMFGTRNQTSHARNFDFLFTSLILKLQW